MKKMMALVTMLALMATPAFGVGYVELSDWNTVGVGGAGNHQAFTIDGQYSYHCLNTPGQITKVSNLDGVQTSSVLVNNSQWTAANGGTSSNITAYYGIGMSGDYVQFTESGSDAVWRVDKNTGSVHALASTAQILSHIQIAQPSLTSVQLLTASTVSVGGDHVFYEGKSDSILQTAGEGTVTTLLSDIQLTALTGTDNVSGGMDQAANGDLYWGNTSDTMWKLVGGTGTNVVQVLSASDITAVTQGSNPSFGDILTAPDGFVYFGESEADCIMRFDPASPAASLEVYVSSEELIAGPMGSNAFRTLGWYDGNLAWHRFNEYGTYVVPEPASLALLALGGLLAMRRR